MSSLVCSCSSLWNVFWVVLRCFWLFYDVLGELFQLVFSCFNCLLFQAVRVVYCLKSLWFVPGCFTLCSVISV